MPLLSCSVVKYNAADCAVLEISKIDIRCICSAHYKRIWRRCRVMLKNNISVLHAGNIWSQQNIDPNAVVPGYRIGKWRDGKHGVFGSIVGNKKCIGIIISYGNTLFAAAADKYTTE